jgi:hypothetical protein
METKSSIHSREGKEEIVGQEHHQDIYNSNEKKPGSFYDDEDIVGSKDDSHLDEDSPIEEVRAVVPK